METQLKAAKVRLVISGADRQLVQAVFVRFLNWWDASGHQDLVASNNIVPLPDVEWGTNSASISLPVNYQCPTDSRPPTSFEILSVFPSEVEGDEKSTIEPALSIEQHEVAGVVGGEMPPHEAHDAASARDWTFHIIDDVTDATLKQFPSEADAALEAANVADVRALVRTQHRRAGPVLRARPRRVAAFLVAVPTALLRILTLPLSWTAAAVARCARYAYRTLVRSGRAVASLAVTAIVAPWRLIAWLCSWTAVAITQCARYAYRTLARSGRAVTSVAFTAIVAPWRLIAWLCSWTARATGLFLEYVKQAVPRVSRRIAAIGTACAVVICRAITIPWSSMVQVTNASGAGGRRALRRVARGSSAIVAPRMVMRAAFVSVVLAVVIAASVARPSRIVPSALESAAPETVASGTIASANVTLTPAIMKATRVVEPAPLPSRSLAMFTAPARMSRVPVVTSRIAATPRSRLAKAITPPPVRIAKAAATPKKKETKPTTAIATVRPETSAYVGSLMVMSEPSGATVRIDGQAVGTTPLRLDGLRLGSHAVHVALDGYPAWSAAATVVYGKSNGVVARLGK